MAENASLDLFYPEYLARLGNLELVARSVVEGFITGLHKSPFHGFSVEFAQHRPYMSGDSLRFVDWKVFARTNRYYIKQFEEETNLRAHLIVDASRSMAYASGSVSKWQYAQYLSATLAHLLLRQRDATGLVLFDEAISLQMPPRSMPSYLRRMITHLQCEPRGSDTQLAATLHRIADQIPRRGLIILISDLFDDPEQVLKGLKHFRHDQHEVVVFQVLDRQELSFEFRGAVRFLDLERQESIKTQPLLVREQYRQKMRAFLDFYRRQLSTINVEYQLLVSDEPLHRALIKFLSKRKRLL